MWAFTVVFHEASYPVTMNARLTDATTSSIHQIICFYKIQSKFIKCSLFVTVQAFKDVRTHCYCVTLLRVLFEFNQHAQTTSYIERGRRVRRRVLVTGAVALCEGKTVRCTVTTFFRRSLPLSIHFILTKKLNYLIILRFLYTAIELLHKIMQLCLTYM